MRFHHLMSGRAIGHLDTLLLRRWRMTGWTDEGFLISQVTLSDNQAGCQQ